MGRRVAGGGPDGGTAVIESRGHRVRADLNDLRGIGGNSVAVGLEVAARFPNELVKISAGFT